MSPRLTCEQITSRLTDLDEGALSVAASLRTRLHLLSCIECRELKAQLRQLPSVMRSVTESETKELLPLAQNALKAALARVSEFHPKRHAQPSSIPSEVERLLKSGADLSLRIMETVHRSFLEGTAPLAAPFLPASVLSLLPDAGTWTWKTRGSARIATLMDAGRSGPRLSLLVAPRGFQTPSHVHFGSEQMLVLDGLLEDGEAAYPTGRWVHFGEGSTHSPIVLNDECWCLIREEGTIRYTGPLGWLRNILAA